jgi:hypothetical protein
VRPTRQLTLRNALAHPCLRNDVCPSHIHSIQRVLSDQITPFFLAKTRKGVLRRKTTQLCNTHSLEIGHEHITNNHRNIAISLPGCWSGNDWIQIWKIQRT